MSSNRRWQTAELDWSKPGVLSSQSLCGGPKLLARDASSFTAPKPGRTTMRFGAARSGANTCSTVNSSALQLGNKMPSLCRYAPLGGGPPHPGASKNLRRPNSGERPFAVGAAPATRKSALSGKSNAMNPRSFYPAGRSGRARNSFKTPCRGQIAVGSILGLFGGREVGRFQDNTSSSKSQTGTGKDYPALCTKSSPRVGRHSLSHRRPRGPSARRRVRPFRRWEPGPSS